MSRDNLSRFLWWLLDKVIAAVQYGVVVALMYGFYRYVLYLTPELDTFMITSYGTLTIILALVSFMPGLKEKQPGESYAGTNVRLYREYYVTFAVISLAATIVSIMF